MSEDLLKELVQEVKLLRQEIKSDKYTTVETSEAMLYLGVSNYRLLTYFHNKGLLNRRRGGKTYVYYKSELIKLADMIRNHEVVIPAQTSLYK